MAGKQLKASVIIGGGLSSSFRSAMSSTRDGMKAIGEEIARVERAQRLMSRSIETFGRMGKNIDGMRERYARLASQADRLRAAQQRLALANERVEANRAARTEVGGQLRGAAAQFGVVAATTFLPIRQAAEFESRMLGVAKQLEGARDAAGNLTGEYFAMARQVQNLGREIPIATNEIADMVAAGLRMGVGKDEVIDFTRTAAMMADAFELPAGALADDMGKIAGLFHIPIPKIGELADAINYLDDNAISKGGDIIDVMRRIGGMAATLGMPAKEAAALGSTFLTLGSTAEVAGTATNAIMQILGAATSKSRRVRMGLQSLGLDPAQVEKDMARDATGTILALLDKLNALPTEQRMVAASRIFGAEYGDDIAKLASGADEYRRQLQLVNGEEAKGSMAREFNARLQTTGAQWQITKNRMQEVAVVIGGALLPAVNDLMSAAAPMIEKFGDWARENPGFVKGVVGSALALSGLRVVTLAVRFAWLSLASPILKAQQLFARFRAAKAVAEAGGQVGRLGAALLRVGGVVRTVGAIIAGIGGGPIAAIVGALTVGALLVRKYWQPIKAFLGGVFEGLRTAAVAAFDEIGVALAPLRPAFAQMGEWIGAAWRWIVNLVAPSQYAAGELSNIAAVGAVVGKALLFSFRLGIQVIGGVVKAVVWLGEAIGTAAGWIVVTFGKAWESVKSTVASAVEWIMDKIRPLLEVGKTVGNVVVQAAQALGFGSDEQAEPQPTAPATRPRPAARPQADAAPVMLAFPARPQGRTADALRAPAAAPAAPAAAGRSPAARAAASAEPAKTYQFNITQQPGESGEALARRVAQMLREQDAVASRGRLADGADY